MRSIFFLFIFLLILAGLGYTWYRYFQPSLEVQGERPQFNKTLADIQGIKNVELDTSLFEDRFFKELALPADIQQPEVAPGRENPFGPFQ